MRRKFIEIGRRLAEFRRSKGLSQKALAENIGLSQGYVKDIETGKAGPSMRFLEKLREAFNLSDMEIEFLRGGKERLQRLAELQIQIQKTWRTLDIELHEREIFAVKEGSIAYLPSAPVSRRYDPDLAERNPGLHSFVEDLDASPDLVRHEFDFLYAIPSGRGGPPTKEFYAQALVEYRARVKKWRELAQKIKDLPDRELAKLEGFIAGLLASREEEG